MSSLGITLRFVQQQLTRYVYSAYLIFGVTGCCLNIVLLTRQQFRTVSCCTYFVVASVAMLISLFVGIAPYTYSLDHENPYTTNVAFCKIRTYVLQSNAMIYRWCLTAASFDRYVLTSTNARLRNFATVRIAYRVVAVMIIVWLLLPIQALVFFNVKNNRCGILFDVGVSLYFSSYTIITGSILPASIMITCAVLIRHNLILQRQRRQQIAFNGRNREHIEWKRNQQIFAMLVLQVIVYLVTQTPWMLLFFYTASTIYVSNKSDDRVAIEQFISYATDMMIFLFPASSFYLYTLVSHTFREELMKLLRQLIRYVWRNPANRINPTSIGALARPHTESVPRPICS